MMLSKSLVSLFALFAAASSVTATATPVRRGGDNGGYPLPSNPTYVNNCNGGSSVCCNTFTTAQDAGSALGTLLALLLGLDPDVGLDCLLDAGTCDTNTLCCLDVSQQATLVGVQCDPVNVNL
ncbi:hypothetical protein BJV74DRAFT_861146 [Russula compacta]|nr:hypothetical protein BJV74DRAFT_861146 [Russula compacta]